MISFYLFWCLSYVALHFWLAKKWPSASSVIQTPGFSGKISLVIPFRNEQPNLPHLAQQVKKLCRKEVEIFLVDDQSEDGSFESLSEMLHGLSHVRVIQSPGLGKKASLTYGISMATAELIVTSDADCDFPENWLHYLTAPLVSPEVQLVAGPVVSKVNGSSFLRRFQQLEWLSILLMTQFSFLRKQPLMCSGANLAFKKAAFLAVGGYSGNEHVLSGDDEFLLKKISSAFGGGACIYLPSKEVLVQTSPQFNWIDLFRQRIRWAGKWKVHRSFSHGLIAVFAFLIQMIWLGSFFLFPLTWNGLSLLLFCWVIKIMAEKISLGKVASTLGFKPALNVFFLTGLVHPIYVIGVGIGTVFFKVKWKGRTQ